MPACEYCQQGTLIITITSEDINIELTSDALLQNTVCVAIISNHVLQCLEGV